MTATLTLPRSVDEVSSWDQSPDRTYTWYQSPHDSSRWMVKHPYCIAEGGAQREVEIARIARDIGFLSYAAIHDGGDACALQHAEDANPGWRFLGTFSDATRDYGRMSKDVWLPYAAFNMALGVGDRHSGNALVLENETTGEWQMVSIDHECACTDYRDCRAHPMKYEAWDQYERATHAEFLDVLRDVMQRIIDAGHGRMLDHEVINKAQDPNYTNLEA